MNQGIISPSRIMSKTNTNERWCWLQNKCIMWYSLVNDNFQKWCFLPNPLKAGKGLDKCNWDHEEECQKKEDNSNYELPNCQRNIGDCQVVPIYITRLWSPFCQPQGWISALLCLCTNSGTPPRFEGDKWCRHDRLWVFFYPLFLFSYLQVKSDQDISRIRDDL